MKGKGKKRGMDIEENVAKELEEKEGKGEEEKSEKEGDTEKETDKHRYL